MPASSFGRGYADFFYNNINSILPQVPFCGGLDLYLFQTLDNLQLKIISLSVVLPIKMDIRIKGPRTAFVCGAAPDLTEYQKQVIFGTMLGDLTAERCQATTGNTRSCGEISSFYNK